MGGCWASVRPSSFVEAHNTPTVAAGPRQESPCWPRGHYMQSQHSHVGVGMKAGKCVGSVRVKMLCTRIVVMHVY